MSREKIVFEKGFKKNVYKIDEGLFSRLSKAMDGDLYPIEAYVQKQGIVDRGGQELHYTDVRIYLKESTLGQTND